MRAGIRKRNDENLTDSAIEDVISKLESDKPITKKLACELLQISYNTTRLNKIIEEYKDKKEFMLRRKKELRNTPVSKEDERYIVSTYLEGTALQEISDSIFRSVGIIKRILAKYNVPIRSASISYFKPIDLSNEEDPAHDYKVGDLVYSARYDCPAEIKSIIKDEKYVVVYGLWLFKLNKNAYQPYYELSDLRTVQNDLGVTIQDITPEEVKQLLYEGLKNAKKRDKD